ncbi:MAG TPA: type II toxin-antitoxin system PemK/MazF family toxin [Ktedonobacteraceae bacterium]|nr:type II toxin-antitoxin system PemK/MazF family toxin [Ktedonobacteraceae bacterium]
MRRGDLVKIALQGDLGKPRPALVIQADHFSGHPTVTLLPVTSEIRDTPLFRISITPTEENGLKVASQIMVDKAQTVAAGKIGGSIGRADDATMLAVNRALAVWLGFA